MILSAKWKVTTPEKMVEVFRSLVTEEFNQANGFKFEGELFECKIEMAINKPQKALETMSQIGDVLSFSYNYPDNGKEELDIGEELDQNTQLEEDENDQEPNQPDPGKQEPDIGEALDQNTQLESDGNDQEPNQPDSGEQELDIGKALDRNTQLESGKKGEESKQPDEGRKERKHEKELDSLAKSEGTNNDLISQIAENSVSYLDFTSKVASRAENLSKEHAAALIEMMLVAPTVKRFTLATIETVASEKTPINSYTMLKIGDEIKGTFNCTKMDFFKKVIGFVHNWDDVMPAKQIKEDPKAFEESSKEKDGQEENQSILKKEPEHEEDTKKTETEKESEACKETDTGNKSDDEQEKDNDAKPEDNGSLSANIEHHDGIFPCMLKPAADKVKAVEIMEGKLRKVEDRNDLTLKEKVSQVIHVLVPAESVAKFESMSEKTAEILQREEIAYDDQTPLEEKDVYLQWSNIANLVSEFYFGYVPESPIQAKYFLLDLKRLLVK